MEQLALLNKQQITSVNQKTNNNQPKFQLRDYQKQVIGQIYYWYRWGKKSVMLVSPTGSGYLIQEINNKQQQQRCIFLTQCNYNLLHKFISIT